MAGAAVFPLENVISMSWPHSASIKAMEDITDFVASKYIIFTDSLSCFQALQ